MHRLKQELKEHSKTKEDTNVTEIQSSTSGDENDIDSYKYEIDSGLEIPSVANSQVIFKPCLFLNILFLIYVATYLHVHDI
jgi:hypothetical protein